MPGFLFREEMCERKFTVIGLSDSRQQFFPPEVMEAIVNGKVFSGGRRHHAIVEGLLPQDALWIDVTVPLDEVFRRYLPFREVVVFASGDPLFYGFAATLRREFPGVDMKVYPAFNSLQLLAHRLLLPYAGMTHVSVTGRPWGGLDSALMEDRPLIGVLTDHRKDPAAIACRLLEYGYDNYVMHVGECLGNESEKVVSLPLQEAARTRFAAPNCVILQMTRLRHRYFGIPESEFHHLDGRGNMITKMPVRLLSLSMLDLPGKKVMWDVGFCTGSMSIEARLRFPSLSVVAFERREESRGLLVSNCRKFGVPGIEGVIGDFMECDLSRYPAPDAVFIGGHGGRLPEMLERIHSRLRHGGTVVFNSVTDDSSVTFMETVRRLGGRIDAVHTMRLDAHNPITIMKALF